MPKSERYNLGQKIDGLIVEILETLHQASFSQIQTKIAMLGSALVKVDSLRFFIQLCWELKLLSNGNFSLIGQEIEDVGKMIGGWRKGLLAKTSTTEAVEEK